LLKKRNWLLLLLYLSLPLSMNLNELNASTTDTDFDKIFQNHISLISNLHWTPLRIAFKALAWLTQKENAKILDVGSGIGKFCIIGAITTKAQFVGIEQRKNLVKISKKIIEKNSIPNTHFILGNFIDHNFETYTGIYLYNPFWENITNDILIDHKIPISSELFDTYNKTLSAKLSNLKQGTRVVTYLMREDEIPTCYSIIDAAFDSKLLLWERK